MRTAVTGSIATDHLMSYPGSFAEQLIDGKLDQVSLSFLADTLEIRRGGAAANIAVGMARLGLRPVLAGAAGTDFAEYRAWLRDEGVDTESVLVSDQLHTARFVCTTDRKQNQIATFYPGAMAEARRISLARIVRRVGGLDLVLVSPNDPEAMLRHTLEARRLSLPHAADPSQQLARISRREARLLVDGARLLFCNEYEAALLEQLTGWSQEQLLERVGLRVTTLGAGGVVVTRSGEQPVRVPAVLVETPLEPTGAGDAFRAGFLAGLARSWPVPRAAQLGCAVASVVLESAGAQEYRLTAADLVARIRTAYGDAAASGAAPELTAALGPTLRPPAGV